MFSTKLTIISAIIAVSFGLLSSAFQTEGLRLFVAGGVLMDVVRLVTIGLLLGLLFFKPPRSIYMRLFFGISGGLLHLWSVNILLNASHNVLDGLIFMGVAVILVVEALEPKITKSKVRTSLASAVK